MKVTDKYIFFWGGILSNWALIPGSYYSIRIYGSLFRTVPIPTSEHYFMAEKARLFQDRKSFDAILNAKTPKEAKKIGRGVKGFDNRLWDENKERIMRNAVLNKAYAWTEFRDLLLKEEWKNKHFVEASPYDKIWGIGMSEDDPNVDDETNWLGQNLLGKCLDWARRKFIEGIWRSEVREHTWFEDITYCPSQIYYFFKDKEQNYVVYLRWRGYDPWTAEVIPIENKSWGDKWDWDNSIVIPTNRWCGEWRFLEEEILEVLRKKFPNVNFPTHPEICGDD